MKKATNDHRLEYEAPSAEIIRLGTEDIMSYSTDAMGTYPQDDFNLF